MSPRHKQFLTPISPPLYEKKNATKVYTEGAIQQSMNMKKKFSEMTWVRQKLSNIPGF